MDKIETPEELIDRWISTPPYGAVGGSIKQLCAMLTARDAAIRADERQKAAGRLLADMVAWKNLSELGAMPSDMLALWITKRVRAAIMAEPKEKP